MKLVMGKHCPLLPPVTNHKSRNQIKQQQTFKGTKEVTYSHGIKWHIIFSLKITKQCQAPEVIYQKKKIKTIKCNNNNLYEEQMSFGSPCKYQWVTQAPYSRNSLGGFTWQGEYMQCNCNSEKSVQCYIILQFTLDYEYHI